MKITFTSPATVKSGAIVCGVASGGKLSPAAKELYEGKLRKGQSTVLHRWADISRRKNYLDALLETGAVDGWEIERIRSDGSTFWALESARLIDFQGEDVIVSSIIDLTERREKDAEIARQREALHQSEKLSALGELLAGVSHELNAFRFCCIATTCLIREAAHRSGNTGHWL